MVTINELIKMKDRNIGGVTPEQIFNNRNNLPGLAASTIDRNTPGGMFGTGVMAGDALNFLNNPTGVAANVATNAGINELGRMTGLGATPLGAGLSLLQGGSVQNVASSVAGSAIAAANPVLGIASAGLGMLGLGNLDPIKGVTNLIGDFIGGIFGGVDNRVSKEEDAHNRNAVNTLLDPNEIARSGGDSISQLSNYTLNLLNNPNKSNSDIAHQIDDVKCRITDLERKMPDGPEKEALKELASDLDKSFSHSQGSLFSPPNFGTNSETAGKIQAAFSKYQNKAMENNGAGSCNEYSRQEQACGRPRNSQGARNRARNDLALLALNQMIKSNSAPKITLTINR